MHTDEIVVLAQGRTEIVGLTLTWAGGQTSHTTARRPLQRREDLSYYPQLVARIVELSESGLTTKAIVSHLRDEGFRHARADHDIGWRAVEQILLRTGHAINRSHQPRRVHPDQAPRDDEWWLADLAAELGVTIGTIHRWRRQGRLNGRQETYPPHRWILHADPTQLADLRTHLDRVRGRTTRVHPRFAESTDHDTPAHSA